jgi:hypothetical protein
MEEGRDREIQKERESRKILFKIQPIINDKTNHKASLSSCLALCTVGFYYIIFTNSVCSVRLPVAYVVGSSTV